jgi:SAM-dependent methyltransferase
VGERPQGTADIQSPLEVGPKLATRGFMTPQPMKNLAEEHYGTGYHTTVHRALIEEDEYFFARARYSAEVYFRGVPRDARVLEYGCGIGQNIALLNSAVGIDVSAEALEAARKRGIQVCETSRDLADGSFDVVLCRHCLEHVERPMDDLLEMRRLLRPGGLLRLVLPRERHYRPQQESDIHQHLYCWNFRAINNLLGRCQFQPTANRVHYVLGFRRLLPLRRVLGHSAYVGAAKLVGVVFRNAELLIDATRLQ